MFTVTLGAGSQTLRLASEQPSSRPERLTIRLCADSMSAEASVYGYNFTDLATFFEKMAKDWRGWPGERTWRSLESDFEITAEHVGHVLLRATLRADLFNSDWRASETIELEPGEQLQAAARDLRALAEGHA